MTHMDETNLNPYHPPDPPIDAVESQRAARAYPPLGLMIIACLLSSGLVLGVLATFVQPLSFWAMPRFGWIGLILCANPLIFVVSCMRAPSTVAYRVLAFMLGFMVVVHSIEIFSAGTVATIQRPYSERLHSAWLWTVIPYALMCVYALWQSTRQTVFMVRPNQSGNSPSSTS